jgi:hypothetical protein
MADESLRVPFSPPPTLEALRAAAERATPLFADAWAREALGDFDGAFALLQQANHYGRLRYGHTVGQALQATVVRPDQFAALHEIVVGNIAWMFTPEVLARPWPGNPSRAPIFIVGLPRSGSTLIEQVLATHSQVQGMGESPAFHQLASHRYPFVTGPPPPLDHFRHLAADYLTAMEAEGWRRRAKPRFVDKQLSNHMLVGSIHLAFPRAVILHSARNPLDLCLSCYRGDFNDNNDTQFCYDLAELGAHYVRYRKVMDHWARVLPGRIVEVRYEDFVADLPAAARRLLAACGLRWEDAVLRFYENPREVATMSREQVRRPIFTDGVGRWRRFERHLGPLIEALGPYADEAGR